MHTQHWKEIERIAYQTPVEAKLGISVNLHMQQALRVLLDDDDDELEFNDASTLLGH